MPYQSVAEPVGLGNDVCVHKVYWSTVNLIPPINDELT